VSEITFGCALASSPSLELQSLHTIITDHYFAPEEKITGVEFAAHVRQKGFAERILLASNGEFDLEKLSGIVDKIVDKQPEEWDVLIVKGSFQRAQQAPKRPPSLLRWKLWSLRGV
jgi:hypothetical protein